MPTIFLDIDGVLNAHQHHPNGYCCLMPEKLRLLAWIVERTKSQIVLASAWRYMITRGAMSLLGFHHLLLICGAEDYLAGAFIDYLPEDSFAETRGALCRQWMMKNKTGGGVLAIDDLDLGYAENGIPLLQPVPFQGLTIQDAEHAIQLLGEV